MGTHHRQGDNGVSATLEQAVLDVYTRWKPRLLRLALEPLVQTIHKEVARSLNAAESDNPQETIYEALLLLEAKGKLTLPLAKTA